MKRGLKSGKSDVANNNIHATNTCELARYEVLKCIQEGLCITEIAKYRKVQRSTIYRVVWTLMKMGLVKHPNKAIYELTDKAYNLYGFKKKEPVKINSPKQIAKVTTEFSFKGDIRNLKDTLIRNKHLFINPPIKEEKRDIPLPIRKKVIARDKGLCVKCGKEGKQIDHIIPFCAGGRHSLENLRLLCLKCHRKTFSNFSKIKVYASNKDSPRILLKNLEQGVQ